MTTNRPTSTPDQNSADGDTSLTRSRTTMPRTPTAIRGQAALDAT